MIAEHTDVVALVPARTGQLGLVGAQPDYPPDCGFAPFPKRSEIGLYVGKRHSLATSHT